MATIPSKQLHRTENNDASLQMNLSDREIGFNSTDKIAYIKYGGVLFPLGISYKDGDGIEIDSQHRINLTERNTFLPKGATEPIKGALNIVDANNTTGLKIRIGNIDTYIGALVPLPENGFTNKVLGVVGEHGELGWTVAGVNIDSPEETIVITSEVVDNQKVYHIELPNLVEAGTYTKVTVNEKGFVTNGDTLSPADIPDLDASKIAVGELNPDRIGDGSIVPQKLDLQGILPFIPGAGLGGEINDFGMYYIYTRIYKGILSLTVTGSVSLTDIPGVSYVKIVSDLFSDGETSRANSYTVTYTEVADHASVAKPTFTVDSNGHLILSINTGLQLALLFDTTVFIKTRAGFDTTINGIWGDSINYKQLVGSLSRTLVCSNNDIVFNGGIRISDSDIHDLQEGIQCVYDVIMVAEYMYIGE